MPTRLRALPAPVPDAQGPPRHSGVQRAAAGSLTARAGAADERLGLVTAAVRDRYAPELAAVPPGRRERFLEHLVAHICAGTPAPLDAAQLDVLRDMTDGC